MKLQIRRNMQILWAGLGLVILAGLLWGGPRLFGPQQLTATLLNQGLQVRVNWSNQLFPANFQVWRRSSPDGSAVFLGSVRGNSFVDFQVKPGSTYAYQVRRTGGGAWTGSSSNWLTVTVQDKYAPLKHRLLSELDGHFQGNQPGRRWIYDDALGVLVYCQTKQQANAARILARLQGRQGQDGALNFFYDLPASETERYIRSGSLAWVGYAAAVYQTTFSDQTFQPLTEKIALYLKARGAAKGKVQGGEGQYTSNSFRPGLVAWYSVEHNIDAYYFYTALFQATGQPEYRKIAESLGETLVQEFWDPAKGYFRVGLEEAQCSLDSLTWGGLFALNRGQQGKADQLEAWLGRYAVERSGYSLEPDSGTTGKVWIEGSWGAALFQMRQGRNLEGLLDSLARSYDQQEATISDKAWGFLVLEDSSFLWSQADRAQ